MSKWNQPEMTAQPYLPGRNAIQRRLDRGTKKPVKQVKGQGSMVKNSDKKQYPGLSTGYRGSGRGF